MISNQILSGERPLYASRDIELHRVTIGEGESGLKESRGVRANNCHFDGMYILWECEDVECRACVFGASSRASLWYVRGVRISDCAIHSPKALREVHDMMLERLQITDGMEAFWSCRNGRITDLQIDKAEYAFLRAEHLYIDRLHLTGKYIFQYAQGIEIHNAVLDTKDAFWESRDCTIYDSEIKGEYLGWYAKNLRLVRCHISGTQPLCYCENLVLEDCTFAPDADLAFEYSSVRATILSPVSSIKNPLSGLIACPSCGEIIRDEHVKAPNNCQIILSTESFEKRQK